MQTVQDKSFASLVERFLGKRLPQEMAGTISLSKLPPDTQNFIMRSLALMRRAQYSATEFNPALIRWFFTTIQSILPSAWGGRIPPLTIPGRHQKLDDYVANQNWSPGEAPHVFIDVGCGFPPVTPTDTSRKFGDWQIYGVDASFDDYVLYDNEGHYACFDQKGEFQYFQGLMNLSGRALYADPKAARNRFNELFEDLSPLLRAPDGSKSETVAKNGNKLIHNHIRDFETNNLTLIKSDLMELKLPPATVIRCMNVLLYFEPEIRKKMIAQADELLDDGGILIAGTNGLGIQLRYAVYRKGKDGLVFDEFAFSLDNLGHIVFMPFFTIHENDPEATLLADLARSIRLDRSFWPDFSSRVDELLDHQGICRRGSDGFLHFPEREMPPSEYLEKNALLWREMKKDGYLDEAVNVLGRAGYKAWKNSVDDIAIRPATEAGL